MPFGSVKLVPGINVERTPTLLEASYASSQLIRFKDSLAQKIGGWQKFYGFNVAGVPRDFHAWQDPNDDNHLLVGTTSKLNIITDGSLLDITPQQVSTDSAVNFSTTSGSASVVVVDADIGTLTTFDVVMIETPIAVGGLLLWGLYQIQSIVGATSYRINASRAATATVNNGGAVPVFTTASGSAAVSVTLANHGLTTVGQTVTFQVSTTGNGVTISGSYQTTAIADASNFTIVASAEASATSSFSMNAGEASFLYYINLGPAPTGSGYGTGDYGAGGYGTGTVTSAQTGTQITATDWTSDNWGRIALACPAAGAVYQFDPTSGFTNATVVATAPPFNGGIFVSNALQILFCWGSTQINAIGLDQDPMLIKWSNLTDYTDFVPLDTNQAGGFRIPIGSVIRTAAAVFDKNLFWTDLDLWAANYAGFPLTFGFNKIGAGAGAIGSHAVQQLRNGVFWMGPTNFYSYSGGIVNVIQCPVWDAVFQNLNTTYQSNVRAMPNTPFNEVGWLYPSASSVSGECDSYVKFNITDPGAPWDYGPLSRSAWMDQTVLGMPIGATPSGTIYQHEMGYDADGQPITASFTTGYFYIAEGEEYAFVDQIIPDMKWGPFTGGNAQVYITVSVVNYPGDTPTTFGPYLMTSSSTYISLRARGRQMSFTFTSSDIGSFWRLGRVRYRWAPDGRR